MANKWDNPDYDEKLSEFGVSLLKWAKDLADEALAEEDNSDYEINYPQFEKFLKVVIYLQKMVHKEDGEWVHSSIDSPKARTGRITARFVSIDIDPTYEEIKTGQEYKRSVEFAEILSCSSHYTIVPNSDGEYVTLSMIIPDVYIKKSESPKKSVNVSDIEQICDDAWDEFQALLKEDEDESD